jgi:hypothetical protein
MPMDRWAGLGGPRRTVVSRLPLGVQEWWSPSYVPDSSSGGPWVPVPPCVAQLLPGKIADGDHALVWRSNSACDEAGPCVVAKPDVSC